MWRRGLGVLGMIGAAVAAAGCDDTATEPDASPTEQVAYIDGMVQHHQIAMVRADEALAKANRAGLKALATRIKTDQMREVAQFKAIRQQLTGSDTTPPAMVPQPIPAGPEFERQWLTMMINHHQGAIDQSTLAHGSNVRSTLDSLAHSIIAVQQREQQEFRDSLRVYYP